MEDLPTLWGYRLSQARAQATVKGEKQWQDIEGPDPVTRVQRINVAARDFFKLYAPSALFVDSDSASAPGNTAVATGGGAMVYWDFSKRRHPYFPALDPWWTRVELASISKSGPPPVLTNPSGVVVKTDPIVHANVIKQAFVRTAADVAAFLEPIITNLQSVRSRKQARANQMNAAIESANGSTAVEPVNRSRGDQAIRDILKFASNSFQSTVNLEEAFAKENKQLLEQYNGELTYVEEQILTFADQIKGKLQTLAAFQLQIIRFGAAKCWITAPWGLIPTGDFSFNRENGLIVFSQLAGVLNTVATVDLELAELVGDGHVEVSFNHELYRGVPEDWSYFYFQRGEGGGPPKFVCVSSPSILKPYIVRDERIVVYENEDRKSLNADICVQQARVYADSILGTSYQQDGYAYEYPGFWNLETSDAVNEVSWDFDGDEAHTKILANFPDDDQGAKSLSRKRLEESLFYGKD